jgi:hypothetical protein
MTSQPSAAAGIVANWVATVPSIISRRCSGVAGAAVGLGFPVQRSSGPTGVNGIPMPSIQSPKSGGAHIRTSCPTARNCSASATTGWTSPRDPIVDNSTRIENPSCDGKWQMAMASVGSGPEF